jgi:hypothetical protein
MEEERKVMPLKKCSVCKQMYPLIDFKKNTMSADGHGYLCPECNTLEAQYRNMKCQYGRKYKANYERHKRLARRYRRLMIGMTPRKAAQDEMAEVMKARFDRIDRLKAEKEAKAKKEEAKNVSE